MSKPAPRSLFTRVIAAIAVVYADVVRPTAKAVTVVASLNWLPVVIHSTQQDQLVLVKNDGIDLLVMNDDRAAVTQAVIYFAASTAAVLLVLEAGYVLLTRLSVRCACNCPFEIVCV